MLSLFSLLHWCQALSVRSQCPVTVEASGHFSLKKGIKKTPIILDLQWIHNEKVRDEKIIKILAQSSRQKYTCQTLFKNSVDLEKT